MMLSKGCHLVQLPAEKVTGRYEGSDGFGPHAQLSLPVENLTQHVFVCERLMEGNEIVHAQGRGPELE